MGLRRKELHTSLAAMSALALSIQARQSSVHKLAPVTLRSPLPRSDKKPSRSTQAAQAWAQRCARLASVLRRRLQLVKRRAFGQLHSTCFELSNLKPPKDFERSATSASDYSVTSEEPGHHALAIPSFAAAPALRSKYQAPAVSCCARVFARCLSRHFHRFRVHVGYSSLDLVHRLEILLKRRNKTEPTVAAAVDPQPLTITFAAAKRQVTRMMSLLVRGYSRSLQTSLGLLKAFNRPAAFVTDLQTATYFILHKPSVLLHFMDRNDGALSLKERNMKRRQLRSQSPSTPTIFAPPRHLSGAMSPFTSSFDKLDSSTTSLRESFNSCSRIVTERQYSLQLRERLPRAPLRSKSRRLGGLTAVTRLVTALTNVRRRAALVAGFSGVRLSAVPKLPFVFTSTLKPGPVEWMRKVLNKQCWLLTNSLDQCRLNMLRRAFAQLPHQAVSQAKVEFATGGIIE